ncbi:MAG TPA: tol-pal system-associated acyl-CoA thioesterase [Woeseiaceae bacterium]|nr:tol-pal system-associated acyl-CoA thioesterase [Woeseiaceae bacterium]
MNTRVAEDKFRWPVRVYYEDTDAQAVVYYANYFRFLERARTEWLRALGVDQLRMLNEDRQIFVVVSTQAEFISPARFNDELIVTAGLLKLTRASFDIEQEIYRGNELLLRGGVKAALLNADTMKPQRVPSSLFEGRENAS